MIRHTVKSVRKMLLVVEMDPYELAVRIAEGFLSMRRPHGMTAADCLLDMHPETASGALKAAENAALFFRECVNQQKEGVQ